MTRFRWIEKERSAACDVRIKGCACHLYIAVAPDRQGEAIWSVRIGGQWGRLIASGFAPALGQPDRRWWHVHAIDDDALTYEPHASLAKALKAARVAAPVSTTSEEPV